MESNNKLRVIGIREFHYMVEEEDRNCELKNVQRTKHIIGAISVNGDKFEIELSIKGGTCMSGWTTATTAYIKITKVKDFNGLNMFPTKNLEMDDISSVNFKEFPDYKNNVFSYSKWGEDMYYPTGFYKINMKLFEKSPRHSERRKVYIFHGSVDVDRSIFAKNITDLSVYETDSNEKLPKYISEDVVVIGSKYKFKPSTVRNLHIISEGFKSPDIYSIDVNVYNRLPVNKETRNVYIFQGPSGVGKSFLAHKLNGLSVYETDSNKNLPICIKEDIIVLGNKYKFTIKNIKSKLHDNPNVYLVNFQHCQ